VFPIDTAAQRERGERWLAQLRESRRAEVHAQHQLKERSLTELLAALPPGLGIWNVPPGLDLSRARRADLRSLEDPSGAEPRLTAFRNARAYFAPAVSWKGRAPRELAWRVEGLPAGVAVEGGWIKFRALREPGSENLYSVRERWVTNQKRRTFEREDLGRLWLRLLVPNGARPGLFPASLVLTASGSDKPVRVPFEVRVLQARAADLDFPVGPFNDNIAEDWWDPAALRPRLERLETLSMAKIRSLGATAFSFSPRIGVSAVADGVSLDTEEVERVMTAAKRLGFLGLAGYGDVFLGENLCERAGPDSILDGARLAQTAAGLESKARADRWLPLALIVCDEPVGAGVQEASDRLRGLPPMDARRLVQWSVTTSLGDSASKPVRELVRRISLPFLSEFSPEGPKFPWAFYNGASRETLGLGMFRLRRTTDLRDRLLWTWNANAGNPYFDFDGRESDYAWCSSTADARLRCSVELDRVVERGLADYRVALGLQRLLEERKDLTPEQRARGRELLREAETAGVDPDSWLSKAGEYQEKL
ncbi:MAG TPA: hypothetical protein VH309_13010, partial [Elusimicrobiota bacterium]|nr:hypothetical protein [Elusimicrobiota bacterium]